MKLRILSFAVAALLCTGLAFAKVNVNTATLEELDTLYGIGEARAQAIIDYRRQNGPFKSLRDLKKVPELPDGVVEGLKGKVSFSGPTKIDPEGGAAGKGGDRKAAKATVVRPEEASKSTKPIALPPVERKEAAPARPATPAKPMADSKPAMPATSAAEKPLPAAPARPAAPAKPAFDSKPAVPAAPSMPSAAPAKPAAPAMPGAPAKPAAPAVPAAKPAAPAAPHGSSGEPDAKAVAPAGPARPAAPARPAMAN